MAGGSNPIRAILYAFFANLAIAIAKTVAAIYTGSSSMTAEAIHSYADTGNQLLLILGLRRARRPPDPEHPLGYGKVTYFWSFVVAALLFSVGGLFSLYEGYHKLHDPGSLENGWIALAVLILAIGLEGVSMKGCVHEIRKVQGDRSLWRWLNESRSSELIVVFGEDVAALLGLGLAATFVGLTIATGEPRFDALGSLSVGILLVVIAVFLAIRVKALLIGRSADPDIAEAIESAIAEDPTIQRVFNVITIQVGNQLMVAAKVQLRDDLRMREACEHINRLEVRLKQQIPEIGWSFMEPDVVD